MENTVQVSRSIYCRAGNDQVHRHLGQLKKILGILYDKNFGSALGFILDNQKYGHKFRVRSNCGLNIPLPVIIFLFEL